MTAEYFTRPDVVIVGGRCAGAATALLLARAGLQVLVVERAAYGSDTLSTHALMRTGVAMLSRWGVLDRIVADGTPLVHRTTFVYGDEHVEIDIRPDGEVPGLFAPRRNVLDRHLADAAMAAGAEFRFGTQVTELIQDGTGRVTGVILCDRSGTRIAVRAGLVIGADGRGSMVARAVGAKEIANSGATTAGVFAYIPGIRNQGYLWHFRNRAHLSVIPTNGGAHCVCAIGPRAEYQKLFGGNPAQGFHHMIASFDPILANTVKAAPGGVTLHRWAGARGFMRRCQGPGWALVGDAGYFKDPLTAHGITDAFRDAALLADAIVAGGPAGLLQYEQIRNRLSHRLFTTTQAIAGFGWTVEGLKRLHVDLNETMKTEHAFMQHVNAARRMAAK